MSLVDNARAGLARSSSDLRHHQRRCLEQRQLQLLADREIFRVSLLHAGTLKAARRCIEAGVEEGAVPLEAPERMSAPFSISTQDSPAMARRRRIARPTTPPPITAISNPSPMGSSYGTAGGPPFAGGPPCFRFRPGMISPAVPVPWPRFRPGGPSRQPRPVADPGSGGARRRTTPPPAPR